MCILNTPLLLIYNKSYTSAILVSSFIYFIWFSLTFLSDLMKRLQYDASESLSMILKWFYFVSALPVLFNTDINICCKHNSCTNFHMQHLSEISCLLRFQWNIYSCEFCTMIFLTVKCYTLICVPLEWCYSLVNSTHHSSDFVHRHGSHVLGSNHDLH